MSERFEYYVTGADNDNKLGGSRIKGQSFTLGVAGSNIDYDLDYVRFNIKKFGSPGQIECEIYNAENYYPSGAILGTGSIAESAISSADFAWKIINLPTIPLTAGSQYGIVLKAVDGDLSSNYYTIKKDSSLSTYSGGLFYRSDNSGTTWEDNLPADADFLFETYGTKVVPDDGNNTEQIFTKLEIEGTEYITDKIEINKSIEEFDTTSSFSIIINNYAGEYKDTFNLNDTVEVWAEEGVSPPTLKLFSGIVEDIQYKGRGLSENIILRGRDYGAVLQDIIVSPRIFKNREASSIVSSLLIQNASSTGVTWNNINSTTTTIDRITFNNISLYDALRQIAEIAGFFFYVDVNKDVHFEERESSSSGLVFDNTNVISSDFKTTDEDIFNRVYVYGDRQLTGARETFNSISPGSSYVLDDKPSNVRVLGSGTIVTTIQPGGIINVNNPATDNLKWLVDYQDKKVILTSGTVGGDNLGWTGSDIIIEYNRSSPIISTKEDSTSQTSYGIKDKRIIDRNITTLEEANLKAQTYLDEHKDPITEGNLIIKGVLNATPGETCIVDMPLNNINDQTYTMISASYTFTTENNISNRVLYLTVNKRKKDFMNYIKEVELRLRNLEGAEVDTSITNLITGTGSISVESSYEIIQTSIGSVFMFNTPNHDILNSPKSVLGPWEGGSIVLTS